jgi:glycosyltransferase involved in cell wall biosynthesis
MTAPSISVVIPVFNAAATLESALSSVAEQTCGDFECLVVDDGSTDESLSIARRSAARDRRFVVHSLAHAGIVPTLEFALTRARGDFVARFDADDRMVASRLERQRTALENQPALAGVGCQVRLFPSASLTDGRRAYEAWLNSLTTPAELFRDRYVECPLAHPTFFVRREVFRRFPYRDCAWPEDYDWVLRVLESGLALGTVAEPLLEWRDTPGRLSRTSERYSVDRFVTCKAHFLANHWLRHRERYVLWGYGDTGRSLARALATFGKMPSMILERHPRRIGQTILGVKVRAPEDILTGTSHDDVRIIVSVAGAKPREEVRRVACDLGLEEGRQFLCAA